MSDQAETEPSPVWVIGGNPSEEELAAVVAVLSARSPRTQAQNHSDPAGSGWSAYWRAVRAPLPRGSDAWRASVRPR